MRTVCFNLSKSLFFVLSALFLFPCNSNAQTRAITETGEEVILYQDGTWKFENDSLYFESQIPENQTPFTKDSRASFLIKSKVFDVGIWIDPKDWKFTKKADNEDAEYEFQKRNEDLYGLMISEKIEIPIETLKGIAIQNAKNVSPDIRIVEQEYRKVNGLKVLMMQMDGTIQGMKFTYFGYYYSNAKGTMQLLTYTSQGLFNTYRKDIEKFLNGFVSL